MHQGKIRAPSNTECEKLLENIESLLCYYLEVKVQNPKAYELLFNIS